MIPTVTPRGSAPTRLGPLTDCSRANRAELPRTGVIVSCSPEWLKQQENAFRTCPPHGAHEFRKEPRDLPDHRIHRSRLGGYDGHDPAAPCGTNSREPCRQVGARMPPASCG